MEKAQPVAMARLEAAVRSYESASAKIGDKLASVSGEGTAASRREELKSHAQTLLELPLLQRRPKVKEELSNLLRLLQVSNNPEPLERWISEHKDYDAVRTANGQKWLEKYRTLRVSTAGRDWMESGSSLEMERWLASPLAPAGERESFTAMRAEEQRAAEFFVREANAAITPLFGKEVRPTVSLQPEGTREPGQFLFHYAGGAGARDARGVLDEAKTQCASLYASVVRRAAVAAKRADPIRPLGKLFWPLAPAVTGSAVGGYYSAEGIRYYFGEAEAAKEPSSGR